MDTLLSMSMKKVQEINEKMATIETTNLLIDKVAESKLCIQLKGGDVAAIDLLTQDQEIETKNLITSMLLYNVRESKEFLEKITGLSSDEPDEQIIEKDEIEPLPKATKKSGQSVEKQFIDMYEAGMTRKEIADVLGIKEESVKRYISAYKKNGTLKKPETTAAVSKSSAKAETSIQAKPKEAKKEEADKEDIMKILEPHVEEIRKGIKNGKTIKGMAAEYNCLKQEMYAFCKKNHIPTTPKEYL